MRPFTKQARFDSDTAYALFEDAADWRVDRTAMRKKPEKLLIQFAEPIDPQVLDRCTALGGRWEAAD